MILKNPFIDTGLEFSLGMFSCIGSTCRRKLGRVSCYDVAFKLRAVAAAEGKSKQAAAQEFKVDVHVQRIRKQCSQKKKLTMVKKSRKTHSLRLIIDVQISL